jgi:hypothetical protein
MRRILFVIFLIKMSNIFAVVPVIAPTEEAREVIAVTTYLRQIHDLINGMADTTDIARQLASLHHLIELQNKVSLVCRNVCDQKGQDALRNYVENLNNNIANQFNYASTSLRSVATTVRNLEDLIDFVTNGGVALNTKQTALALQRSLLKVQAQSQVTLSQTMVLLNQQAQRSLAQEKLDQAVTKDIYIGIKKSGL